MLTVLPLVVSVLLGPPANPRVDVTPSERIAVGAAFPETRRVEIDVAADNACMLWVDGQPYDGLYNADWRLLDTVTLQLPVGDHVIAVYVEDWGGVGWFAATVRVDGQVVSVTGDSQWRSPAARWEDEAGRDSWERARQWSRPPVDGRTGLLGRPPVGWIEPEFDDRDWLPVAECRHSRLGQYAAEPADVWDDFDRIAASGARFVHPTSTCRPDYYTTRHRRDRQPAPVKRWSIGLFRGHITVK